MTLPGESSLATFACGRDYCRLRPGPRPFPWEAGPCPNCTSPVRTLSDAELDRFEWDRARAEEKRRRLYPWQRPRAARP
jgi:hypothetical protein